MAGVETTKSTVKSVAHQGAHFDEERRKTADHKNSHIDKSKTDMNYNIGEATWKNMMSKAREEVKRIDKEKPPIRKKEDRKTMVQTIFYCPNEIKDHEEFFKRLAFEFEKEYPNSLMGLQVHVDEQHKYIDSFNDNKSTMSMIHAHAFIIPNDQEKGINMKSYLNRDWYKKTNEICERVANSFGSTYHNGKGHHVKRDVEQMKMKSLESLEKMEQSKMKSLESLENIVEEKYNTIDKLDNFLNDLKAQISDLKSKYEDYLKLTQKQAQIEDNALKRGVLPLKVERVMGKANEHKKEIKSIYDKLNQKTLTSFYEESLGNEKSLLDSFEEENKSYKKELLHISKVLDGEEEEDDYDR